MRHLDLIVIGTGSAGSSAAQAARRAGARVAVVERDRLGGECPHYACIPTKAMLRCARVYRMVKRAGEFGVRVADIGFDWSVVAARRDRMVDLVTGEERRYAMAFEQAGIAVVRGTARFVAEHTLDVDGERLAARHFVIATGSLPAVPDIPGLRETGFLTNLEASRATTLPASVAIIGGGPVGVEFAQIYAGFEVPVVLIEQEPQLLPREEREVAVLLRRFLEEAGVRVLTDATVVRADREDGRKRLHVRVGERVEVVEAAEILVAVGRRPAVDELELSRAGVQVDPRGVVTDPSLRTTLSHIWAAGDVVGRLRFTHVAAYEGHLAGMNATSGTAAVEDLRVVPRVTFADPEVASVGLTEAEAARDHAVSVRLYSFAALARAHLEGEARGLVKIIADAESGALLGGHIIGPHAGELIHEIAVAMENRVDADGLAGTIHAFPTLAEAVGAAHEVRRRGLAG